MTIRETASRWLMRQWLHDGWFARIMAPLGAVVRMAVRRKQHGYATGARQSVHPGVPVVVVGNIFVGGTGKTPVVIALATALRRAGWTPGMLSRGYGVDVGHSPRVGRGTDIDPVLFGDEPALLAQATGAALSVHPQRVLAAQALLQRYPDIDVLISDDGLQHLALARDIEIVVQDERGVGNGRLLPAGPLREPASRLDTVDVIITRRAAPAASGSAPDGPDRAPCRSNMPDRDVTRRAAAPGTPWRLDMHLRPGAARHLTTGAHRPLGSFGGPNGPRSAAVAGIGQPQRFFDMLGQHGIVLTKVLPLADHHAFTRSPFDAIQAEVIFITSKDAVKCRAWQDDRLWEVPVQAEFSDPCFPALIIERLDRTRCAVPESGKLL